MRERGLMEVKATSLSQFSLAGDPREQTLSPLLFLRISWLCCRWRGCVYIFFFLLIYSLQVLWYDYIKLKNFKMCIKKSELITSTSRECSGNTLRSHRTVNLSSNKAYCLIKHRNENVTPSQIQQLCFKPWLLGGFMREGSPGADEQRAWGLQ